MDILNLRGSVMNDDNYRRMRNNCTIQETLFIIFISIIVLVGCSSNGDTGEAYYDKDNNYTSSSTYTKKSTDRLPLSEYSAIIEAVQSCHIAKVRLIILMNERYLTHADKIKIDSILLDCAVDKLRSELNKGG